MYATIALAMLLVPAGARAAESDCPLPADQPAESGPALNPEIALSVVEPDPPTEVVNFGHSRGVRSFTVVLEASQPLPATFTPGQLELDSPRRPRRVSDTLESARLPPLTFSRPTILAGRKRIAFQACVDSSGAKPGSYTGQILVSGPRGLAPATIAVTANLKSFGWFLAFLIGTVVLAFVLLLVKAANDKKQANEDLFKAIPPRLTEGNFWIPTVIGLGGAVAAMVLLYTQNPSWGGDLWGSLVALVGAAFSATGLSSFIKSFSG